MLPGTGGGDHVTADFVSLRCSCGSCADTYFFPFILWSIGSLSFSPSPLLHLPIPLSTLSPSGPHFRRFTSHHTPLSDHQPPEDIMSTRVVQQSEGRDTTRSVYAFSHPQRCSGRLSAPSAFPLPWINRSRPPHGSEYIPCKFPTVSLLL